MPRYWTATLPQTISRPFEVYVSGILQTEGEDYTVSDDGTKLQFERELVKEEKVSTWRWMVGIFGIGVYRRDDQIDVGYTFNGKPVVAHHLDITPPGDE